MRQLKLEIEAKPFSTNAAYIRSRSHGSRLIRNKDCRNWGDSILQQIQKYAEKFQKFRDNFDPSTNALSIKIIHEIPKSIFYTKQGEVSIFSKDLTNIEKLPIDLIFDQRFHGRTVFGECVENLAINDKYITKLISEKKPAENFKIKMDIKIITNGRENGTEDK